MHSATGDHSGWPVSPVRPAQLTMSFGHSATGDHSDWPVSPARPAQLTMSSGPPLLTIQRVLQLHTQPNLPHVLILVSLILVCPGLAHRFNPARLLTLTLPDLGHFGAHMYLAYLRVYRNLSPSGRMKTLFCETVFLFIL